MNIHDTSGDTVPPGSGQRFLRTASTRAVRSVGAIHARRFDGITRPYTDGDVERLRGSVRIAYTLADMGAKRLWELLHVEDYLNALGALTGNQAVQMVRAGLKAIYLSGWQVAASISTTRPSPGSSVSWGPWGTSSSSSPWPAFTP